MSARPPAVRAGASGALPAHSFPGEDHRSARQQTDRRGSTSAHCPVARARARRPGWHARSASRRAAWICRTRLVPKGGSAPAPSPAGVAESDGDDAPDVEAVAAREVWWQAVSLPTERLADRVRVPARPAPIGQGSGLCHCPDSSWSVSPRLLHRHTNIPRHAVCILCEQCRSHACHERRTRRSGSPTPTRKGFRG